MRFLWIKDQPFRGLAMDEVSNEFVSLVSIKLAAFRFFPDSYAISFYGEFDPGSG
ncbi:Uncharacterised protein [Mycobacterium tuberculosis]|nr:Uncharacterised protein [Mycobacterium tuberculosis]